MAGSFCDPRSVGQVGEDGSLCPACTEGGKFISANRAGTNCESCPAGKYNDDPTATLCKFCPEGKDPNGRQSACVENHKHISLRSLSPSACDARTPANDCMGDLDVEIVDDVVTIVPTLVRSGSFDCPSGTGTIDGGVASGTIVSSHPALLGPCPCAR